MNAKKCDRCGKFYDEYNTKSFNCDPNIVTLHQKLNDGICYLVKDYDLCPECMAELQEWLNEMKQPDNKPWFNILMEALTHMGKKE